MSETKMIYGLYDDDGTLTKAAKNFVSNGLKIKDVYAPFPIHGIEKVIGIKARINYVKAPKTEVYKTCANISKLKKLTVVKNSTKIKERILNFIYWYKKYKKK